MAFSHQERWLEYVLSKIAEIKGTASFDSGLNKRNLKQVDVDLDNALKRIQVLEATVSNQGETIVAQGKLISSQAETINVQGVTIANQSNEINKLWEKVNSL